jgi:hypothetical protein
MSEDLTGGDQKVGMSRNRVERSADKPGLRMTRLNEG